MRYSLPLLLALLSWNKRVEVEMRGASAMARDATTSGAYENSPDSTCRSA